MDLWKWSKHCLELEGHKKKCSALKVNTSESTCRMIINGLNDCLGEIEAEESLIFCGKDVL